MRDNDCVCYCHDIDPTNQEPITDCVMCGCTAQDDDDDDDEEGGTK